MKLSKFVLALVAAGSCVAASAQMSDSADQERRARNREEAIANHERMMQRTDVERRADMRRHCMRDMRHDGMRDDKPTVGERIDHGASSTKNFTHRTLNKMRNFGDRQNHRHPAPVPGTCPRAPKLSVRVFLRPVLVAATRFRDRGDSSRPRGRRTFRVAVHGPPGREPSGGDDPPRDDPAPLDPSSRVLYAHAAAFRGDPRVAAWLESWADEALEGRAS